MLWTRIGVSRQSLRLSEWRQNSRPDTWGGKVECLEERVLPAAQAILTPEFLLAEAGSTVSFDVRYQTEDAAGNPTNAQAAGIGVKTFFDSSKLTFQSLTNKLTADLVVPTVVVSLDGGDLDNNPDTDSFVNIAWNNTSNQFPGVTQPVILFTANFIVSVTFTGSTQVDFAGTTAIGFQFKSSPVTISASATSLTVTATSTSPSPTRTSPIPVSVVFSDSVTGFTADDLVVSGAAVTAFGGSGTSYTFALTPGMGEGLVTVDIPANAAVNGSGIGNQASATFGRVFDNVGPLFTSASFVNVIECNLPVMQITATDTHPMVTYSLSGGADVARFGLDATTGQLRFLIAPELASPADANADNVYEVQITATDNLGNTRNQNVLVTVVAGGPVSATISLAGEFLQYRAKTPALQAFSGATFNISGLPNPDFSKAVLVYTAPPSKARKSIFTLGILSTGTSGGQIQVFGNEVLYGGVVIGTTSSVRDAVSINFNSAATENSVQALIRSFTYSQTKRKPLIQLLGVSFRLDRDSINGGPGSASAFLNVRITR